MHNRRVGEEGHESGVEWRERTVGRKYGRGPLWGGGSEISTNKRQRAARGVMVERSR